jgi:hypothetical protein
VEIPQDWRARVQAECDGRTKEVYSILGRALDAAQNAAGERMAQLASVAIGISKKQVWERIYGLISKSRRKASMYRVIGGGTTGWEIRPNSGSTRGKGIALYSSATQEDEGVNVTLAGKSMLLPGTFLLEGAHGFQGGTLTGVFYRANGKNRLPIRRPQTESIAAAIARTGAEPQIEAAGVAAAEEVIADSVGKLEGAAA